MIVLLLLDEQVRLGGTGALDMCDVCGLRLMSEVTILVAL